MKYITALLAVLALALVTIPARAQDLANGFASQGEYKNVLRV
jgi:hypothetical protein